MMHGMIVTHDGKPKHVRTIQRNAKGVVPGHDPATYTLQDWEGTKLTRLVDPLAEDIPLLPACPECGPRFPGDYGSAGWHCRPGCKVGVWGRAKLVTA